MTANNIRVATAMLKMYQAGETITISAVAQATGIHVNHVRSFLQVWSATGWLNIDKAQRRYVFTLTDDGAVALARLVSEYKPDRKKGWPRP